MIRSEEKLNLVLSSREIGIWEWDVKTGAITWTEVMEKLFGFAPGTFPGTYDAYRSRIPHEDFAVMERSLKTALELKTDHVTVHRVIWPNGEERWIQGRGRAHFDSDGKPVFMAGTSIDITEQKRLSDELEDRVAKRTAELSESRASLDSLIENIPNMVFVKDAKTLRFVRFNRAGERLLGFKKEDLLGKNDYDFFPKDQAEFFVEKDRTVLRGHEIVDIPEERIQTRTGDTRILHTKKIPLFDINGEPEFLLGISEDITDQKRAEEQRMNFIREQTARAESDRAAERARFLADAGMRLSSALNSSEILKKLSSLVVPAYSDWCTITIESKNHKGIERVVAVHSEPEKQTLLNELFSNYTVESDRTSGIVDVMNAGKPRFSPIVEDGVLEAAAKDERHLFLMRELGCKSSILVPIQVREKTIGVLSFVYGNSGRRYNEADLEMLEEFGRRVGIALENARLYEQAQQAIQLRNEFLSIASHELKTPVTSLKLRIQLAKRRLQDKSQKFNEEKLLQNFDASEKQVDRLIELIENLLDITRIESGKLVYSFESHNLSAIVKEIVENLGDQLTAAKCTIESDLAPETWINCDRFRIEQVFINLLANAMKYGAGRPIRVSSSIHDKAIQVEVKDNGSGIDSEDQRKIFDRFFRVTSHRNISGLGLGLYISKQIVLGHKGSIRVESQPGKGANFIVEFPRSSTHN